MHLPTAPEILSAINQDDATMAGEMTRAEFMEYMQAFEQRLDGRFESLERSMKVQFEDTRGDIPFSLEGLAALREATEKGFEELRTSRPSSSAQR